MLNNRQYLNSNIPSLKHAIANLTKLDQDLRSDANYSVDGALASHNAPYGWRLCVSPMMMIYAPNRGFFHDSA